MTSLMMPLPDLIHYQGMHTYTVPWKSKVQHTHTHTICDIRYPVDQKWKNNYVLFSDLIFRLLFIKWWAKWSKQVAVEPSGCLKKYENVFRETVLLLQWQWMSVYKIIMSVCWLCDFEMHVCQKGCNKRSVFSLLKLVSLCLSVSLCVRLERVRVSESFYSNIDEHTPCIAPHVYMRFYLTTPFFSQ